MIYYFSIKIFKSFFLQKACFTLHSKMNIENELSQFDELIRLEEDNLRTAVTSSKDLYGQDDIIESKFQELLDLIQEKRYVKGIRPRKLFNYFIFPKKLLNLVVKG